MPGTGPRHTEVYAMVLTPMYDDPRRTINYENLLQEIDWCAGYGVDGLVIAPSIGEAPHMKPAEREEVFRVSMDHVREYHPHVTMIAMTADCNSWHAIDYAVYAKELGYHAQQLTPPYYWKTGEKGVYRHFELVGKESELPIILYHNPGLSKIQMKRELIGKITHDMPEIFFGIKETETDPYTQLVRLFKEVHPDVPIYNTFRAFFWGLLLGARGGFINAPTLPACVKLAELFDKGENEKAKMLQEEITVTFPQKGERNEDSISLTKAMTEMVTGIPMGNVREPYIPASALQEFKKEFEKKYEKLQEFMAGL